MDGHLSHFHNIAASRHASPVFLHVIGQFFNRLIAGPTDKENQKKTQSNQYEVDQREGPLEIVNILQHDLCGDQGIVSETALGFASVHIDLPAIQITQTPLLRFHFLRIGIIVFEKFFQGSNPVFREGRIHYVSLVVRYNFIDFIAITYGSQNSFKCIFLDLENQERSFLAGKVSIDGADIGDIGDCLPRRQAHF